jgi:hypothetical protein
MFLLAQVPFKHSCKIVSFCTELKENPLRLDSRKRATLKNSNQARPMNILLSRRSTLLCAIALFAHVSLAGKPPVPSPPRPSSGTLVLDLNENSEAHGLTVAPSGIVYASGTATGDGLQRGLVLASSDRGSNWFGPLDDFVLPGFSSYHFGGMISDAAGNLYTAGFITDDDYVLPDRWIVRGSADAGANWTTVDDFSIGGSSGHFEGPTAITVNTEGDVFVSGVSYSVNSPRWIIRKGAGGTLFSTVDLLATSSQANAIFAHPTAGLFAAGYKSGAWVVRRSRDGGATWHDVDSFQLSKNSPAVALGIGADGSGNLYVVGRGRASNGMHWLVRKSTDGGNSWSTVDDFMSGNAEARLFGATFNGNLFVAGVANNSGLPRWIIRKDTGATGSWTTVDDYKYDTNFWTEPYAIAADAFGNLFVGGSGGGHWIIKKY